jgi:sporulation protein YlmC with PRC-barrel domain
MRAATGLSMLAATMRLELGTSVRCTDGHLGKLADLVVDPRVGRVTHLVVSTGKVLRATRLVPLGLTDPEDGGEVRLHCTVKEARALQSAEGFACLRPGELEVEDRGWDVGIEHVLVPPSYPDGDLGGYGTAGIDDTVSVVYDRIPKGEVEIRRGSLAVSSDDKVVGAVEAVVVDGDSAITHVVIERGRLWNRRNVTIPIAEVSRVETDSVTIGLTKLEVRALRSVRARHRLG